MTQASEITPSGNQTAIQLSDGPGNHTQNIVMIDETLKRVTTQSLVVEQESTSANQLGKKKVVVIMTALCLVLFLAALDVTIVSTALPEMATYFHASESGYSWMASSYLLANAASLPIWGRISDIWGRKPIILFATSVFIIGSLVCALAHTLSMVLAGRSIQGAGGGGIVVLANICVSDLFSVRERSMYFGLFGSVWAIASALGPIIGGVFTAGVTWRWCFWINLPIGGVSLAILAFFLDFEPGKSTILQGLRAIDWTGILLIFGGTLMFLFGLEFGGITYPWVSSTVLCLIIFGIITCVLAILNEWKCAKYPVVPIRIFASWHNVLILFVCFCHGFVYIAGSYFLPLYFQTVLLANPIMSGVYVLPQLVVLSVTTTAAGFIVKKTGRYYEMSIGAFLFLTLGYGLFIDLKYYASWQRIIIYQVLAGIGAGPLFTTPLIALQANIHPSDVATGTATFTFVRQIASAISMVLGTVVYQNIFYQQLSSLTNILGSETAIALSSFFGPQGGMIKSLPKAQEIVVLNAFTYAFSHMWILFTAVAGCGLFLAVCIRPVALNKAHLAMETEWNEQETHGIRERE
ncbi:hypothetical protein BBP40_007968 [Aspergillus hancockii]|nr:hypothetical protein BBP40_007968 [Aspergillus hancockii]